MKDFEVFVQEGDVKKQPSDSNLAKSLVDDSKDRLQYAKNSKLVEESAKYVYENVYESLREAADSILAIKGFKSFSHEASISFLQRFKDFSANEISEFDRMRKKRNGMKYYGKTCSAAEVKDSIEFAEKLLKKILEVYKSLAVKTCECGGIMRIVQLDKSQAHKCEKCGEVEFTENQAREFLNKKPR
ncbi:MAG: hypothetical protein A2062_05020 [Omnitrophica WOR_2 bacterium GWA2_44_7]|nr:MAG: hypothetical protein A2062_05020 [Omnitrophica WOR_2 bacterium GWA2_44_7]